MVVRLFDERKKGCLMISSNEKANAFNFLKRGKIISFVYDVKLSRREKQDILMTLLREGKISSSRKIAVERLLNSNLTKYDAVELGVR